jgi:NAD(P)-dependent dehydrogenase (short-subunit alcohol dehydrogenase family)
VAVLDIDESNGVAVAREVGGIFIACDVGNAEHWEAATRRIADELGGLDFVHLNAGIATRPPAASLRDDIFDWIERGGYRRIMGVNIDGVVLGLRAVVPMLERRGSGSIVATASIAGLIAFTPDPFYTMTKHAVVGLVKSLAPLLQPKNIRLNAICPAGVDTPIIPADLRGGNLMPPSVLAAVVLDLLLLPATGEAWVKEGEGIPAYRYEATPLLRERPQ